MRSIITLSLIFCCSFFINAQTAPTFVDCPDTVQLCYTLFNCDIIHTGGIINATESCPNGDDIYFAFEVDIDSDGTFETQGFFNDYSGDYPLGLHTIIMYATDECNLSDTCEFFLNIEDCRNPVPQCIPHTTSMGITQELTITTDDINNSSWDNCDNMDSLVLLLQKEDSLGFGIGPRSSSVTYDCDDIGVNPIRLWARDLAGNETYCFTTITIEDPNEICPNIVDPPNPSGDSSIVIAGKVMGIDSIGESDVTITISNGNPVDPLLYPAISDNDGNYSLEMDPTDETLEVRAGKIDDVRNGCSTFDITLIRKHHLSIEPFTHPYQIIAADVDNSNTVSVFDLVTLRRVILEQLDDFPNTTPWIFYDAAYTFNDPLDPNNENYPTFVNVDSSGSTSTANFFTVKLGDVNRYVIPNTLHDGQADDRSPAKFVTTDQFVKRNQIVTVPFRLEGIDKLIGLQMDLTFDTDRLEYLNIEGANEITLDDSNLGKKYIEEGRVMLSWDASQAINISKEVEIINIQFQVKEPGLLSEAIEFSSTGLSPEAYSSTYSIKPLQLIFEGDVNDEFRILPNPMTDATTILFGLDQSSEVAIQIFNQSGQLVYGNSKRYDSGNHTHQVSASSLLGAGLYYVQLEYNGQQFVQKLILTK